jgi:uncharacterized membrane protein
VLEFVGLMSTLAVGLLISMATVGTVAFLVCAVAGGGCWMWLRRRRPKPDQPEQ